MNLQKLFNNDPKVINAYILAKFKDWNGILTTKSGRINNCVRYYNATYQQYGSPRTAELVRNIIEEKYQQIYGELFPTELAKEVRTKTNNKMTGKVSSLDWLQSQECKVQEAKLTAELLKRWLRDKRYEEGESFFYELQSTMAFIDPGATKTNDFHAEYQGYLQKSLYTNVVRTSDQYRTEFDAMVGISQKAKVRFDAYDTDWGEISAKLNESFKLGAWANGTASSRMSTAGIGLNLQGAVAIGAHLAVDAECIWKKNGGIGLKLAGKGEVFAGANASGQLSLDVNALKGINAAISAKAFAGFRAEVSGMCSIQYDGKDLITASGTAGIMVGVGGSFEAKLKTSIFGPTEMSLHTSAALGVGVSVGGSVSVDFNGIYLAAGNEFRKVVYMPTLLKGYKMDLMTQDAKNLYYLNKCIRRLEEYSKEASEEILSYEKLPVDKRPLLRQSSQGL